MKIPKTVTECYEALGLVPRGSDLSKGSWKRKAMLCRILITEFLELDAGNLVYESRDKLDQFQQRAETWVGFNASKLWAATDRAGLSLGAPIYPRDKIMYVLGSISSPTAANRAKNHEMDIAVASSQAQGQKQAGQFTKTSCKRICSDINIGECEGT